MWQNENGGCDHHEFLGTFHSRPSWGSSISPDLGDKVIIRYGHALRRVCGLNSSTLALPTWIGLELFSNSEKLISPIRWGRCESYLWCSAIMWYQPDTTQESQTSFSPCTSPEHFLADVPLPSKNSKSVHVENAAVGIVAVKARRNICPHCNITPSYPSSTYHRGCAEYLTVNTNQTCQTRWCGGSWQTSCKHLRSSSNCTHLKILSLK